MSRERVYIFHQLRRLRCGSRPANPTAELDGLARDVALERAEEEL
jgi:hypothetical protein